MRRVCSTVGTMAVVVSLLGTAVPGGALQWACVRVYGRGVLGPTCGVAADSSQNVYVPDYDHGVVQKFAPNGARVAKWYGSYPSPFLGFLNHGYSGIALSGGYAYVSAGSLNWIEEWRTDGTHIRLFGQGAGSGDGQFNHPDGVALNAGGDTVYVADTGNHRIQKWTSTGTFLGWWGKDNNTHNGVPLPITGWHSPGSGRQGASGTGDGQFTNPTGVAVDGAGNLYVADRDNHRIQKFTIASTGGWTFKGWWGENDWNSIGFHYPGEGRVGKAANGTGAFNQPSGVAVDSAGQLWVADTNNNRIQFLNLAAHWQIVAPLGPGQGCGQLRFPKAVAVDSAGNVYVTDDSRVQKLAFVSHVPVANADSLTTNQDTPLALFAVLDNDTDAQGHELTAVVVTQPQHGKLATQALPSAAAAGVRARQAWQSTLTYTPNPGYSGTDYFFYQAYDGFAYSNVAKVNITVVKHPVDLIVDSVGLTPTSTSVAVGTQFTWAPRIKNIGTAQAGSFKVYLWKNTTYADISTGLPPAVSPDFVWSVPSLAAGSTCTLGASSTPPGPFTFTPTSVSKCAAWMLVDATGQITESDDGNNYLGQAYTVTGNADLYVLYLTVTPAWPTQITPLTYTVSIWNYGSNMAGPLEVELWCDRTLAPTQSSSAGALRWPVPAVPGYSSVTLTWTGPATSAGNHKAWVWADRWDHVPETNETNNMSSCTYAVYTASASGALAVTAPRAAATRGGQVAVTYSLSAPAKVDVHVLNIAGRLVRDVVWGRECDQGQNELTWDACAATGARVPDGRYLVQIEAHTKTGERARAIGSVLLGR